MTWTVVGAAVAGTRHDAGGVACQDAAAWTLSGGRLVVAVADGAGSAARAAEGAELAVQVALGACARRLDLAAPTDSGTWDAFLVALFDEARCALLERAATSAGEDAVGPSALATTLVVAIVSEETLAVGHLGDGSVVVERDGEVETLSPGRHGEFVNQTFFLTDGDVPRQVRRFVRASEGIGAVVVVTDGLQDMAFDGADRAARAGFFRPLLAFARSADAEVSHLERFLRSDGVCARTDDDKTAVIAVRA
jgi:Protein phosphatase 2C